MTTRSRSLKVSFAESSPGALRCSARSSAASNAEVADAEISAQLEIGRVLDLYNHEHATIAQGTTNLPLTYRHADNLPESREEEQSFYDKNRLYVTHWDVQRTLDSALLSYEENTMRRISDERVQNTLNNLLKTTTK